MSGHAVLVPALGPELSSIQTVLVDLVNRLGTIAAEQQKLDEGQSIASELFAIEGLLNSGNRRLARVVHRIL